MDDVAGEEKLNGVPDLAAEGGAIAEILSAFDELSEPSRLRVLKVVIDLIAPAEPTYKVNFQIESQTTLADLAAGNAAPEPKRVEREVLPEREAR